MSNTDNIAVVLVNTQHPGNIGSTARAMNNMGISDLVLVNTVDQTCNEARIMAVDAVELLETARRFDTLTDAISDRTLVFGTTRRSGKLRNPQLNPWEMAELIAESIENNNIAIVFGPEHNGLTTDDLNVCHHVVRIPADKKSESLNLSHAVIIILYELKKRLLNPSPKQKPETASIQSLEDMYAHMEEVLLKIGFLDPQNPRRIMITLKSLLTKSELQERDVQIIRGMLRQFDWYRTHKM
jgi:TrmH family RNA methyltransferase